MHERIIENLRRQERGLELLLSLLKEEFTHLAERNPKPVTGLEFSVHELMRQLMVERTEVKSLIGGGRLLDYTELLAASGKTEAAAEIAALYKELDRAEQACARASEQNTQLVLALMDQNQGMLDFLHKEVQPKGEKSYGRKGGYAAAKATRGNLVSGRL